MAGDAPPKVTVTVNQTGLAAGKYYGLVRITAPGAANTPHVITVLLRVLPSGTDIGEMVTPNELVFVTTAGTNSPGSQSVFVYNIAATPKTYSSSVFLNGIEVDYLPGQATLALDAPTEIVVQPVTDGLAPGVYHGNLTLQFSDGRVRDVRLHLIVKKAAGRRVERGRAVGRNRAGGELHAHQTDSHSHFDWAIVHRTGRMAAGAAGESGGRLRQCAEYRKRGGFFLKRRSAAQPVVAAQWRPMAGDLESKQQFVRATDDHRKCLGRSTRFARILGTLWRICSHKQCAAALWSSERGELRTRSSTGSRRNRLGIRQPARGCVGRRDRLAARCDFAGRNGGDRGRIGALVLCFERTAQRGDSVGYHAQYQPANPGDARHHGVGSDGDRCGAGATRCVPQSAAKRGESGKHLRGSKYIERADQLFGWAKFTRDGWRYAGDLLWRIGWRESDHCPGRCVAFSRSEDERTATSHRRR